MLWVRRERDRLMYAGPKHPPLPTQEELELRRIALEEAEHEACLREPLYDDGRDSYEGRHELIESQIRSLGLSYREEEGLPDEEPFR